MKKSLLVATSLRSLAWVNAAGAADLITAPLLAHAGHLVTCQAVNVGPMTADVKVDLIDTAVGSVFGPAVCGGTPTGGTCMLALGVGADRLIYCRVAPGKKKNIRASIQINGGAAAVAQ